MAKELNRWMPMFWADYFRGTQQFTNATEHGAYLLLIAYCWNNGGKLPADDNTRRRIAKCNNRQWQLIRDILMSKFDDEGRNERCSEELAYAIEKSKRLSANAKHRLSIGLAEADTPTPTPTKKESKEEGAEEKIQENVQDLYVFRGANLNVTGADFEKWRKAYPKIKDLKAALQKCDDYYLENPRKDGKYFYAFSRWLERENEEYAKRRIAEARFKGDIF